MARISLADGWSVLQDVHHLGEKLEIYKADFDPTAVGPQFSEWEAIERLDYLQLLFARSPYFGRELRHYNMAPWWYRNVFHVSAGGEGTHATLRFEGVDYFCSVWLNEQLVGEHEGYALPFEFEVGHLLRADLPNVLVVKVSAPWDRSITKDRESSRFWTVIRDMMKGTYEHDDTFVQRDVNPIGIWGPVQLRLHDGLRLDGRPSVQAAWTGNEPFAEVSAAVHVDNAGMDREIRLRLRIMDDASGIELAAGELSGTAAAGRTDWRTAIALPNPGLWQTWDRGESKLYRMQVELWTDGRCGEIRSERFGIRQAELLRTKEETVYYLNGSRFYVRGTTYFPDVYVSAMHTGRYRRDLEAIKRAGFNTIRIHVHMEQTELYDLCDEMGIAVVQDSDFNWTHPADEAWKNRAVRLFGDMIRELRNHPSIITWICMNEPDLGTEGAFMTTMPGPQLLQEALRLDPGRPAIKGSYCNDDPDSGDSHNYIGSLNGQETHYTDIDGTTEKLNTEFGFDAPPHPANLRQVPALYNRLKKLGDGIGDIQYYQYRLLKYYTEHYRLMKYKPCGGYFQFMFIDFCPQSFYGMYDWWGMPKEGLRAMEESNQPIGIFLAGSPGQTAIWLVNDTLRTYPRCTVEWTVSAAAGDCAARGSCELELGRDSIQQAAALSPGIESDRFHTVRLTVRDADGRLLAHNPYRDPFMHPPHPEGHPHRMSHELGMRLFWA